MTRATILISIIAGLILGAAAEAQQHPNQARGFDPGKPFQMNGLDNINLFNGNLTVAIPIGQPYHVNGGLSYAFSLVYSGNVWDSVTSGPLTQQITTIVPNRRSNAGMGWLFSLGRLIPPSDPTNEATANGTSNEQIWVFEGPDGHDHVLYDKLHFADVADGHFYSRDGTYIRMTVVSTTVHNVEFPDGTYHVYTELDPATWQEIAPENAGYGVWKLTSIRDQFGNSVGIAYGSDATYAEKWTITDGVRTQRVYFRAANAPYTIVLDHAELTSFGNTGPATWSFGTTLTSVDRGPGDNSGSSHLSGGSYSVPLLTSVTLPSVNGASQQFSTFLTGNIGYDVTRCSGTITTNCAASPGHIRRITTPNGGRIEWDYAYAALSGNSLPRTQDRAWAVTKRYLRDAGGSLIGQWTYDREKSTQNSCIVDVAREYTNSSQLVTSLTSPEGTTSIHYFSVFTDSDQSCVGDVGDSSDYGSEFSPGVQENGRYLSSEIRTGNVSDLSTGPGQYRVASGTPVRSEWARYESDSGTTEDRNSREVSHLTKYEDDGGCAGGPCFSSTDRVDFDGLGHYRHASTAGNFPKGGNYFTSFVNYAGRPSASSPWLLNTYSERCTVEESAFRPATAATCADLGTSPTGTVVSGPQTEQFCFNSLGFLLRHRSLAGIAPGPSDAISAFTPDGSGNLSADAYYGGDTQTVGTDQTLCAVTLPPSPAYAAAHTYANGSLSQSYYTSGGTTVGFNTADTTIDPNTGLPSASKDPSGLSNGFTYDVLGRLASITPPGQAATNYTYSTPSGSVPPSVTATTSSSTAGNVTATTTFDVLGRPIEERHTLPGNVISKRQMAYTASGWVTQASQWESTPSHFNKFEAFDAFGRASKVTAADGSLTDITYTGVRKVARRVRVNTCTDPATQVAGCTLATTTEEYDGHGRLVSVTDASNITTTYGYDVAGRLLTVSIQPAAGAAQMRSFQYSDLLNGADSGRDARGFLRAETHPETGKITYGNYDAMGHVGTKFFGATSNDLDLSYSYDAAERLITVAHVTNRINLAGTTIKTFHFGTAGTTKGKLDVMTRHNFLTNGDDIVAQETFSYNALTGLVSTKVTNVKNGSTLLQEFSQGYTYNDLGLVNTSNYPTCDASRPCGVPAITSISPGYLNGVTSSIPNFAESIDYNANGSVFKITHHGTTSSQQIVDQYDPDPSGLARPIQIQFRSYDNCTRPAISQQPQSVNTTPNTVVTLSVTASTSSSGPLTYQWYQTAGGIETLIAGATSAQYQTAVAVNTTFYVRVVNACGAQSSSPATVTVSTCGPQITGQPQSSSPSPGSSVTLSVTATTSCGPLTYHWYLYHGSTSDLSSPVGTNSSTFTTPAIFQTARYWVRVSDTSGTTVDSGVAVLTVALSPPFNVSAVFTQIGSPGAAAISWQSNGGADHYEVRRVGWDGTITISTNATSLTDPGLTFGKAYAYSVRSVDQFGGSPSAYSTVDLAINMNFTPVFNTPAPVTIAFAHFTELLNSVNSVREASGHAQTTWRAILDDIHQPNTPVIPVPASGERIYAAHILALRKAMEDARIWLGISQLGYTDDLALPTVIKGLHVYELQRRAQ